MIHVKQVTIMPKDKPIGQANQGGYLGGNNMENKNIFRNFGQSKVVFVVFMLIYNFLVSVVGDNCHEDMTEKRGGGECHKMNGT